MGAKKRDGHERARSRRYDAYYCVECDEWLEPRCLDSDCDYCSSRPERPSDQLR